MNFISIAGTATCWQSAGFIPCPPRCVCLRDSQDSVYELRMLCRRGELLSEPSPSVNVSTTGRCSRAAVASSKSHFNSSPAAFSFCFSPPVPSVVAQLEQRARECCCPFEASVELFPSLITAQTCQECSFSDFIYFIWLSEAAITSDFIWFKTAVLIISAWCLTVQILRNDHDLDLIIIMMLIRDGD